MTNQIKIFAIILFSFYGCTDCDLSISPAYRNLVQSYSVGDTILFSSATGDIDTITVVNIDSFEVCGSFITADKKSISIEIKHLPNNNWNGGIEHNKDGTTNTLNQELITVGKDLGLTNGNYVSINYRNFNEELSYEDNLKSENSEKEISDNLTWKIKAKTPTQFLNENSIIEILWTEKFGLTSYTKNNGESYKIVNLPQH